MELIKIYQGNIIDARELWNFLEVVTPFDKWIKRTLYEKKYGFVEGRDFSTNLSKSTGGRPSKEYYLTLETAKEVAMLQKTEKGKEARKYFIQCEQKLKELANNKRLEAYNKLNNTLETFKGIINGLGFSDMDFVAIDNVGKHIYYNGKVISDENTNTINIRARDLASSLSAYNISMGNIIDLNEIEQENARNHLATRETVRNSTGKKPEEIQSEENIEKLKNDSDNNKLNK